MDYDISAARAFLTTHARVLDRRRFELLFGAGEPDRVLAALDAYRNDDGGYGWALEPDLRAPESQPVGAMHAFEVLAEAGPVTSPHAAALCDWLASVTLPGGGVPFALPMADGTGSAPFWVHADPAEPSLAMAAQLAGTAHQVAGHDAAVREHPWLAGITTHTMRRIGELTELPHAIETKFVLGFLNAVHDAVPGAAGELRRLAALLPDTGVLPVSGGAEDEAIRPVDLCPEPGPLAGLLGEDVLVADLKRLAVGQQADGGWTVDWRAQSPAGALDWRGYATVGALKTLRAHGW